MELDKSTADLILSEERTNLSWVRTGLAFIVLGTAVVRLISNPAVANDKIVQANGTVCVAIGLFMFFYSYIRYTVVQHKLLNEKKFLNDSLGPIILVLFGIVISALGIVVIYVR
jgi:uncharacterized membrane protein YidH (DUF202 family)